MTSSRSRIAREWCLRRFWSGYAYKRHALVVLCCLLFFLGSLCFGLDCGLLDLLQLLLEVEVHLWPLQLHVPQLVEQQVAHDQAGVVLLITRNDVPRGDVIGLLDGPGVGLVVLIPLLLHAEIAGGVAPALR